MLMAIMLILTSQQSDAQKLPTVISGGAAIGNDNLIENLEVGKVVGRTTVSLIGESYQSTPISQRQWSAGFKYYREVYSYTNRLSVKVNASTEVNLVGNNQFIVLSPGFNLDYSLGKKIQLRLQSSSPIYEGGIVFKPINLQTGVNLVLTL